MFEDRIEAGERLFEVISGKVELENGIVLGLARGGVVVARIISENFGLPLDALVVKKIGVRDNPELAVGAVGPASEVYWDENLCERLGLSDNEKNELLREKILERKEREVAIRGSSEEMILTGRSVLIVDDGVATGATVVVAARSAKKMGASKVFLAVPVIAFDTLDVVEREYDKVFYVEAPRDFYAVGQFFKNFPQVSDEEVRELL